MSESPAPSPRPLLWLLLIIPFGLVVGWFVAQLPTPRLEPSPKGEPPATAAAAHGDVEPVARAGAPPAEPSPKARPLELSEWTTLDNAMAESQRTGRPVMVDFNAEWCGPCQAMKQQLFEDLTLGKSVRAAVIPVSIVDRVREDGGNPPEVEALMQRFDVNVFPTLVVLSPRSGKAVKTQGFGGPDETLEWITRAAREVR